MFQITYFNIIKMVCDVYDIWCVHYTFTMVRLLCKGRQGERSERDDENYYNCNCGKNLRK